MRLEAILKLYKDNPKMLENLLSTYSEKLSLMKKNINKPYFARIDFSRDGGKKTEQLYIGKVGVMDEDNKNITIDWRAPISSMYYDSNIGRTSYIAPEGTCRGELLVKRQYDIENGKLNGYQDVDTVANDELLKPYLETGADNRLKNIVSTIQIEQNAIIRESLFKNIIVQGVAGSGKTTVALHRIAYLVYNNRGNIKPEQYLVIGPNKFFVDYISSVLPDLDVNNVRQLTYDELCSEFIKKEIQLINEENKIILSITNSYELEYEKLKVSMVFKKALDKFLKEIDKNIVPDYEFSFKGYKIISRDQISEIYDSLNNNIYDTIEKKIDKTKILLEKHIEDHYEVIRTEIIEQYHKKIIGLSKEMLFKEMSILNSVEKELKNNCKSILKKYFSSQIPDIIKVYIKFLMDIKKYINIDEYNISEVKIKENILNIKNKKVEFEDLSALIYLECKINGVRDYDKYKQVAIDEAQDYGEFSFYALKFLLHKATFSIFGDLAQSIYQYRGIKNWEEVVDTTFKENCEIKYLLKSYRTTTEIMNSTSNITKHKNLKTEQPVIRHENMVKYTDYKNTNNLLCTSHKICQIKK